MAFPVRRRVFSDPRVLALLCAAALEVCLGGFGLWAIWAQNARILAVFHSVGLRHTMAIWSWLLVVGPLATAISMFACLRQLRAEWSRKFRVAPPRSARIVVIAEYLGFGIAITASCALFPLALAPPTAPPWLRTVLGLSPVFSLLIAMAAVHLGFRVERRRHEAIRDLLQAGRLPCLECGYDCYGCVGSRCPECGSNRVRRHAAGMGTLHV